MFSCCFGGGNQPKEAAVQEPPPEAAVDAKEQAKEVEEDVTVDARDITPAAVVALVDASKVADAADKKVQIDAGTLKEADTPQEVADESLAAEEFSAPSVQKAEELPEESLGVAQPDQIPVALQEKDIDQLEAEAPEVSEDADAGVAPVVDKGDGVAMSIEPEEPISFDTPMTQEQPLPVEPMPATVEAEPIIAESAAVAVVSPVESIEVTGDVQPVAPDEVTEPVAEVSPVPQVIEEEQMVEKPEDEEPVQAEEIAVAVVTAAAPDVTESAATDSTVVPASSVSPPEDILEGKPADITDAVENVESTPTTEVDPTQAPVDVPTTVAGGATAAEPVTSPPDGDTQDLAPVPVAGPILPEHEDKGVEDAGHIPVTDSVDPEPMEQSMEAVPMSAVGDHKNMPDEELKETAIEETAEAVAPDFVQDTSSGVEDSGVDVPEATESTLQTMVAQVPAEAVDSVDASPLTTENAPIVDTSEVSTAPESTAVASSTENFASSQVATDSADPTVAKSEGAEQEIDTPDTKNLEEPVSTEHIPSEPELPVVEEPPANASERLEEKAPEMSDEPMEGQLSSSTDKDSDNPDNGVVESNEGETANVGPAGPQGLSKSKSRGSKRSRSKKKRSNS